MRRDKQESQAQFNRRAILLAGVGGAAFAALGARLYSLQILEQERYRLAAADNQFNFRLQPPTRGRLLDRFGEGIAVNRDSYRLLIVPEQAGDPRAALERLSAYMPLSEARIERLLRQIRRSPRFKPVTIAEDMDWETFSRINLQLPELPGITPDLGEVRTYPHGPLTAHVTGYVQAAPPGAGDTDPLLLHPGFRIGRTGVEASLEDRLRGEAGQMKVEVNSSGRVLREMPQESNPPVAGEDVRLTIDVRSQRVALEALDGQAASAVALDMLTGEILTLVSSPSFDPNPFVLGIGQSAFSALNTNPYRPLFNKATTGIYAPASTIKGAVALAALEQGVTDPEERILCTGSVGLGNRRFHCWRPRGHGTVNLHDAIKGSCDVYFYEIARRLGIENLGEMARRLGLGELHDIGMNLPDSADGLVPSERWKLTVRGERWSTGDTYNAGIGQGFMLASPLQLAVMTARLATGRVVEPTLLPREGAVSFASMGINQANLDAIGQAHRAVVHDPRGTAYWVLDAGRALGDLDAEMAGKTGTAQVYSISAEERAAGVRDQEDLPWRLRNHGLFIAYGPFENPRYAVAVVVEHGGGGSSSAARPARDILRDLVRRDPAGQRLGPLASANATTGASAGNGEG
ncbi:penicillin-binding protein 2 [Maricaulaceae bacterium EIL42A08]|nr:penicillin-binding protein 2 [Maricaulaceae bacterium EIL42A08]